MVEAPAELPPACVRSLRAVSAREHRYAEAHRKSAQVQRSQAYQPRSDRLNLIAVRAKSRASEIAREAR